ncbi:transposase [Paraburkholderia diazotrophica]|uniref:transposase n=1 Tax=Paraburkholderia diazotrophica TaxID=667676 RepID=UPI0031747BE8
MPFYRELTDEEWERVSRLLPELRPRPVSRGRPLANTRAVLNGVLWIIVNGATWASMPRRYPPYQTCHRRFMAWRDTGVLQNVFQTLYGEDCAALHREMGARISASISAPPGVADTQYPAKHSAPAI